MVRVELFYFDGCPHWTLADERLSEALSRLGRDDVEVELRKVETAEDAERVGFTGSPTIRGALVRHVLALLAGEGRASVA
ncbi:hypothetical protein [Ornithinimicrobium avium]|uniref:hypothetical protein n=1 Tax=Ornithinimicrobium avium TaxID=2283195 RepID=UPI001D19898C|nr:hypothetical protein [Ornithinimicrobium avium]